MINVSKLLEDYHFDILKDMVRLLGIDPASNKKVAHIEALRRVLFTPQGVEKGLSQLSQREKDTLAVLQRADGRMEANRLRLQLLRQNVIDPPGDAVHRTYPYVPGGVLGHESRRTDFKPVIGRLMATGLICGDGITYSHYSSRSKIHYDNVSAVYIADEVKKLLPDLPPPEVDFEIEHLTRVQESSARAFQRDVYFYWSTAHSTPLSLTKNERLYKRDLRLVNDALQQPEEIRYQDEPDYPRLIFLRMLLTDLGLLVQNDQNVCGVDRPPFLGQKPTERIHRTYSQWRDGPFWNEVLSVPKITVSGAGSRLDPAPEQISQARKRVLAHMADLHQVGITTKPSLSPEERWVPIAQLVESLRIADYGFLFPRNYSPSPSHHYSYYGYTSFRSPYISYGNEMGWNVSPRFDDEEEGWEIVEAGFIRAILLEPLHWMGLLDIGYAGERPVAYRLTQVGEWALGVGKEITIPEGEGKVIVQPNFEIFALDPISDLTLAKLDEFADRMSAERAIKYQLTRESVYRAQRSEWTSARIIETLNRMSDTPLPQNVSRTMEEWQIIHERIKIYRRGSLLQAADSALLDRLTQDAQIFKFLVSRPDPTVALVTSRVGETEELARNLQAAGYPPARTRSADDKPRPSFTIDDTGQMHFATALPSIYLFAQIAPFTGKDERGRYYLTQSAVQGAIGEGMSVEDILERLRALHLGPLPRWIEIKIRAWGHYYGDAAVQTITLVQIADEKTLQELLAEPELEGILHPFAPDEEKALATIASDDIRLLYELLAERNISISEELD